MEEVLRDKRLEGETLIRQCQLTELVLLDAFLVICKKYDLQYFIYGGTLLGAVRHGGFIPWDDDIDVAMPKTDYKKFLKIAQHELPESMLLMPCGKYAKQVPFAKIYDRYSFMCEPNVNVSQPCGIFIDIFPYQKVPKLPKALGRPLAHWCFLSWITARIHRTLFHKTVLGIFVSGVKAAVWMLICYSLKAIHYVLGLVLPRVWRCSPEVPLYQYHEGFSDEIMFPLRHIEFEGRDCMAPNDVDAYLTQYYGDWREMPPLEKRQWHASIICPVQAPDASWALPYPKS